jgi:phosphoglycerol transferase MdoB-like AlkP superfamily enzyme
LGYKVDGVEVTPFLNQLKDRSMYFRVRANHDFGSADADFALLNGVLGSPDANSWLIRGYPYANTTPQLLAQRGYKTTAFHGNTGSFYNRREAYEKLGLDAIYFREDLDRDFDLETTAMGVTDAEIFGLSARMLANETGPVCHFIITLTTHTPYASLKPEQQEIYPHPANIRERYINNMRYIDNCLRAYVDKLGSDTTVFLYADHPTESTSGFESDRNQQNEEYIPCLIYDADQDLAKLQQTRSDPQSTDGSWHMVDIANYLRGQITRSEPKAEPQAALAPESSLPVGASH